MPPEAARSALKAACWSAGRFLTVWDVTESTLVDVSNVRSPMVADDAALLSVTSRLTAVEPGTTLATCSEPHAHT